MKMYENVMCLFVLLAVFALGNLSASFPNCSMSFIVRPDLKYQNCTGINLQSGEDAHFNAETSFICALDDIWSQTQEPSQNSTVCVTLLPGSYELYYSNNTINVDVIFEGSGLGNTIVSCSDEPTFNNETYKEFPLQFGSQVNISIRKITFSKCARPLFIHANSVTLEEVSFHQFTQSALEIYNTPYITVNNCTFTNNTSTGQGRIRNSGNAGAMSIGFNETFSEEVIPEILIQDCSFKDNSATVEGSCSQVGSVLFSKIYTQRGGAIAGYFATPGLQSIFTIRGTTFENNRAQDSGGAVYINLSGTNGSSTYITYENDIFVNNTAIDGGAIETTFDIASSVHKPSMLIVQNCLFKANIGTFGGALYAIQISSQGNLNRVIVENCIFCENRAPVGSAIHFQSLFLKFGTSTDIQRIRVENSTFIDNIGQRSIVFIAHNNVNFTGNNHFSNNTGTAIRLEESLLSVTGDLLFLGNTNHHEGPSGTLYVYQFSQILLDTGTNISFINNTGRDGAAIVVKSPRISSGFAKTLYNPQCFLQFASPKVPPIEWKNQKVTLTFSGNRALLAPVLLITSLDPCSWYNNSDTFFETDVRENWSFMTLSENYIMRRDGNYNGSEQYIQTEMQALNITNPKPQSQCSESQVAEQDNNGTVNVCAYPGQIVRLDVTALDQFGRQTSGFLHITPSRKTSNGLGFTPSIAQTSANNSVTPFQYNSSDLYGKTLVTMEASFSATRVSSDFLLVHLECPPGLYLDETHNCVCEVRPEVLTCDPFEEIVLLKNGLWGAPPSWSRTLVTYACPPGYCNCSGLPGEHSTEGCALIFADPESLCDSRRTGPICGQCKQPYGVGMLGTHCREFKTKYLMYYWLIPLLVLFIIIASIIIIKMAFSIPPLLLAFLFFIQVAPITVLPVDNLFRLKSDAMSCIASTLAIYVPYDFSLRKELSALESFGLRYISPLLILIIAPIILRINYHVYEDIWWAAHSVGHRKPFGGLQFIVDIYARLIFITIGYRANQWNGIWTLILLTYAMVVHTSCSLLFCPSLTRSTNGITEKITVWFYDGSVRCFQGAHIVLTIVAIAFLLLAILLIPVMTIIVLHKELRKKFIFLDHHYLAKISLVIISPYKDIHRWWAPFELIRRLVLIISAVFSPARLTLPLSFTAVLLTVQWYVQPYKDWKANVAEVFSLCILVILLCFGSTVNFTMVAMGSSKFTLWPLFYLPLLVGGICLLVLLATGLWNVFMSKLKTYKDHKDDETVGGFLYSRRRSTYASRSRNLNVKTQVVSIDDGDEEVTL